MASSIHGQIYIGACCATKRDCLRQIIKHAETSSLPDNCPEDPALLHDCLWRISAWDWMQLYPCQTPDNTGIHFTACNWPATALMDKYSHFSVVTVSTTPRPDGSRNQDPFLALLNLSCDHCVPFSKVRQRRFKSLSKSTSKIRIPIYLIIFPI